MNANFVDQVQYMGFQSYGVHQVPTKKSGQEDFYIKDAYKDISDYHKRKVDFYDDKPRYDTIYKSDYLKSINEDEYKKGADQTIKAGLAKYNYAHDPNLTQMVTDRSLWKSEDFTRTKFAESIEDPNRQKVFSNWHSTYNTSNSITEDLRKSFNVKPSQIDDHFKSKYHRYHCTSYKNEQHNTMGRHGDIPFEKFFLDSQPKFHNDNYPIALGTTKPTSFIPGYAGFIPTNNFSVKNDKLNDPYFSINKTNHLLNYKIRLPSYHGFVPQNQSNIKGNTRPFCLSTKGETFC